MVEVDEGVDEGENIDYYVVLNVCKEVNIVLI